ncbi:hypothetical protein M5K25_015727 [Dendrobium thyrsiflorum]|uniref:Uncharacterized protein n=1 Tax=Dendrobium thyrsiflorum TaxID=117978 RepID=A0ABD0UR26_DENTH
MVALVVVAAALPLYSVLVLMLDLETGTVSVVLTTLLVALAASNVVVSRRTLRLVLETWMVVMCHAHEVMALAAVAAAVVVAVPVGNLVTGFAPDRVAMSITLQAEWNAFDAMLLVILVLKCEKIITRDHENEMIAVL